VPPGEENRLKEFKTQRFEEGFELELARGPGASSWYMRGSVGGTSTGTVGSWQHMQSPGVKVVMLHFAQK